MKTESQIKEINAELDDLKAENAPGAGYAAPPCSASSLTPETDAIFDDECKCSPEMELQQLARKLERERNEARGLLSSIQSLIGVTDTRGCISHPQRLALQEQLRAVLNPPNNQAERPAVRVQRTVRPDPRIFSHFPPDSKCPICGTNDDGTTVLVEISGTAKDRIAQAKPMHLACAISKQWDEDMGIALTWPNAAGE